MNGLITKLNKIVFTITFLCFTFTVYSPQAFSEIPKVQNEFLSPSDAFKMSYDVVDNKRLKVRWDIHPGYYLYMGMFEFESLSDKISIEKVKMPEGKKKKDEFFGDVDVYYYTAEADIYFSNNIVDSLILKVKYQGCAEAGLCYPPIFKTIDVKKKLSVNNYKKVNFFENQSAMSASLTSNSLLYNSLIFYLAGLLLAFTPCVLPMVPILTGIIAGQGIVSQRKSVSLSIIYVLSMASTYALAGIIVAISGTNIQASLQNPYVIGSLSLLFLIFALAMFNFFSIQMPKSFQNFFTKISNRQKSGNLKDVAIMGFLSALIVGPCVTAPLIGALVYIATTSDVFVGGLALFALGLGMGTPLIVLGSTTTKLISKIGPYLELVNYFFGILFIIVAVWLMERIISIQLAATFWALASALIFFTLIRSMKFIKNITGKILIYVFAGLFVVYPLLQIMGISKNKNYDPIFSFIEKEQKINFVKINTVKDLNKLVNTSDKITMVDLYADWCVACKELEKYTFAPKEVSKKLNEFNVIKFDITVTTEEHSKYLQEMRIFGPPALFFFDTNGDEIEEARVIGFIDSEKFLEILKIVKK